MKRALPLYCFCSLLIAITLLSFTTVSTFAQNSSSSPEAIIPLEGLDPVMLSQGKEVQGDMKFKVTRGRFQYIFASPENKATFEKDPARYEIQLDGFCARMGAPTTGDPDLYAVHDGRIYIFGSPECKTLFVAHPENYLEVPVAPKSPTAEMMKRGQELIAKAVDALGGSKLDQLVSFQQKDVRGNDVKNILLLGFPDAVRQESIRPTFTLVSVVTPPESFFVVNNTPPREMPEANRISVYKELNHELVVLLRARNKSDFKASAVGSDKVGETAIERVNVEVGAFTTTLGIDPTTGRVLNQTYRGRGPGGVIGDIAINYSDYRAVEGLSLPFKLIATFDGQPFPALTATVEAMTINGQVDPASFKKPKPAQ
jgi:YHS domain-containing protein